MHNRVILVGMTARAIQSHPQKDRSKILSAIEVILGLKFRRNRSAFRGRNIHPHVSRRHALSHGWTLQKIPRQLPSDKIIKRQILIEGFHHPVAIWINPALVIKVQAMGIAITHRIQPVPSLMLTKSFAAQQLIDQFLKITTFEIRLQLLVLRRQPRQDQGHASSQRLAICFRSEAFPIQFCLHQPINTSTFNSLRLHESPMLGILPAALNPSRQQLPLGIRQLLLGILRRHGIFLIMDANQQFTVLQLL